MYNMQLLIQNYLEYCHTQKCLDLKTLKAYRIDLRQFSEQIHIEDVTQINSSVLEQHIASLHQQYRPKTAKRKIATLKAFFHYLEYREVIALNPFNRIQIHFREPVKLPKTIPLQTLELLLTTIYAQCTTAPSSYQQRNALRDAAVTELLFSSGMRISELCALRSDDINLCDGTILIYGKGSKERRIQLGSKTVIALLNKYYTEFHNQIHRCQHFFANQNGTPLSDQSVRRMINKYCSLAAIEPAKVGDKEKWQNTSLHEMVYVWDKISVNTGWENQKGIHPKMQKFLAKYDGIGYYGIGVKIPQSWKGKKISLLFGSVDESAWVYVNGKLCGTHIYTLPDDWQTPFAISIEQAVDWSKPEQTIIVKVEDNGGQGGIWRPVMLVVK